MGYEFKPQDLHDFARSIGADTYEKGNELFFRYCPKCHGGSSRDRDTFSVNLDNGTFKCFRASCDYHGHFVELARDFGYPLDFGERKVYKKLPQKEIVVRDEAIAYLGSRGISADICRKYKVTAQSEKKNILVFPFYDENGILQFVKYRKTDFDKKRDKNKEWCERDTKPILFGMKQCEDKEFLIITEGQIDSLSVAEAGFKNAVSVPNGALGFTWLQNCWEWICEFQEVICFGDFEKGNMTLLDTLISRLPQRVKAVREQDYLGEKDANAILCKFGKQAIVTAIENAAPPKLSNVKDLSTVHAVDINTLPKIKTNIPELDRVIGGIIYGQVVLLTGKRGNGKSTFIPELWDALLPTITRLARRWAYEWKSGRVLVEAADLMQTAFLTMYETIMLFDTSKGSPFVGWLLVALRNDWKQVSGVYTAQQRFDWKASSLDEPLSGKDGDNDARIDMVVDPADCWEAVNNRIHTQQLRVMLDQAMSAIPRAQREVLQARYYSGLSVSDCAARLGIPDKEVERLERRGLQSIRFGPYAKTLYPAWRGDSGEVFVKSPYVSEQTRMKNIAADSDWLSFCAAELGLTF